MGFLRLLNKNIKDRSGLTMLEAIVAMGIVVVGMTGVFSLTLQNIKAQNLNKNFLVASMLAQEAVELIRNQRDTNQREGWDWQDGDGIDSNNDILQDDFLNTTYTIDYRDPDTNGSPTIDDTAVNIDSPEAILYLTPVGYYVHTDGGGANQETPFKRLVTIDDVNSDADKIQFQVLVKWNERGRDHEYQVDARLYDWW